MIGRYSKSKFIPATMTILNLPPTFRNKFSVGTFVLSVFQQNHNSDPEKFLFKSLIIEELKILEKGIAIVVNNNHYFVTAQVIQFNLDTKGAEQLFNVEAVGSFTQCFLCRRIRGKTKYLRITTIQ
jgi:hypothetical protein